MFVLGDHLLDVVMPSHHVFDGGLCRVSAEYVVVSILSLTDEHRRLIVVFRAALPRGGGVGIDTSVLLKREHGTPLNPFALKHRPFRYRRVEILLSKVVLSHCGAELLNLFEGVVFTP